MKVQLLPEQNDIGNNRGPATGMFALQQALRKQASDWFSISDGPLDGDTIPWFWETEYGRLARDCHKLKRPFIVGPNVLFGNSRKPREQEHERIICDSPYCLLIITDGIGWYERLIRENLGPESKAEVVAIPYPVTIPQVDHEIRQVNDVLIYVKSGVNTVIDHRRAFPYNVTIYYGSFERRELLYWAHRSKCCLYLSDDDRGPIAAAEILLTGCPLIGIERGCPWVAMNKPFGMLISDLTVESCKLAVEQVSAFNRKTTRFHAEEFFSPNYIAQNMIDVLDKTRGR